MFFSGDVLRDFLPPTSLKEAVMKPPSASGSLKNPVKFRLPTAENLVPIRLDIEIDGKRFKDAFTWNASDPDSEVVVFARRTVKDLKFPTAFVTQIAQSIQSQLIEFRSYEGQDMHTGEKVVPIKLDLRVNHTVIKDHFFWDMTNFEGDPEEFARTFCEDMKIEDPEVGPAIAIAIREQLYEIAKQGVASVRESRTNKKGRRGMEHLSASKVGSPALDLGKLFDPDGSIQRGKSECDTFEPIVSHLSNEEVDALEAREERLPR
ncbi:hypothetical protein KY284_009119 [Solanum tuberosum]|nr:hypothetical protein KY284_009119 [Solanum tuberosum]